MTELRVGMHAPDFDLPTDGERRLRLSALRGRKVVLYFYPKDDTEGCTREAIAFNALRDEFTRAGTEIVGISADPPKSHDRFKAKHGLGFALASDETTDVLKSYGLWVEKKMYGRTFMGIRRTTILIDDGGRIARIWEKVRVDDHADEVLEAARAL